MFALDRGSERRRKLEKSEESDVQMVQKAFRDGNEGLHVFTEVTLNLNSKDLLLSVRRRKKKRFYPTRCSLLG